MADHADADLILKLYDLRRETVCREARSWFRTWKPDAAEVAAVQGGAMVLENAYLRQATTYWEMAFSIANAGVVDATLFAKNCAEGIFFAMKCQRLGEQFGEAFPRRMSEAETFIAGNALAQDKAAMMRKRLS